MNAIVLSHLTKWVGKAVDKHNVPVASARWEWFIDHSSGVCIIKLRNAIGRPPVAIELPARAVSELHHLRDTDALVKMMYDLAGVQRAVLNPALAGPL